MQQMYDTFMDIRFFLYNCIISFKYNMLVQIITFFLLQLGWQDYVSTQYQPRSVLALSVNILHGQTSKI